MSAATLPAPCDCCSTCGWGDATEQRLPGGTSALLCVSCAQDAWGDDYAPEELEPTGCFDCGGGLGVGDGPALCAVCERRRDIEDDHGDLGHEEEAAE